MPGIGVGIGIGLNRNVGGAIEQYSLTFTVIAAGGSALENASININSETKLTNVSGQAVFTLPADTYAYSVTLAGYTTINDNVTVTGDQGENVSMVIPDFLDLFTNAAVAFSLRRLKSDYAGDSIRVRRISDNAEQDIGFVLSEGAYRLDTASLETFCAATNGFIVTLYDQSGNGLDVTQATANLQPQIVSSGSTMLLNGEPSIYWDVLTANKKLVTSINFPAEAALTSVSVFANTIRNYNKLWSIGADSASAGYWFAATVGGTSQDWVTDDSKCSGDGFGSGRSANVVSNGQVFTNGVQYVDFIALSAAQAVHYINNAEISYRAQAAGATDTTDGLLIIGNGPNNTNQFGGDSQEIILYTSDKFANQAAMALNQNTYYGAY
jgi:hypothetical protein